MECSGNSTWEILRGINDLESMTCVHRPEYLPASLGLRLCDGHGMRPRK